MPFRTTGLLVVILLAGFDSCLAAPKECTLTPFRKCLIDHAGGRQNPLTCEVSWRNMQARDECKKKFPN